MATSALEQQDAVRAGPALRAEWQPILFAKRPRRLALRELAPSWPCVDVRVAVHRNAPFEFVAEEMPPFLAYAGYRAAFSYSDYDDSLHFAGAVADLHLVWLDFESYRGRIEAAELATWLVQRVEVLRSQTMAPLLIANWPATDPHATAFNHALEAALEPVPGARVYDRRPVLTLLGERYWDERLRAIGATNLGGRATLEIARDLGLRWVPAALRPPLKGIAVDLDLTLYDGVLGEDGIAGVSLTPEREALQRKLVELRNQGLFLGIVSKNEPEDVEALFRARSDFPLRREDFSAVAIGWNSKADGLRQIADALRIAPDALLLLDDNIGEIADVQAQLPEVRAVHAAEALLALTELTTGPDLLAWAPDQAADVRALDLVAAEARRTELTSAADPLAYLQTLETRLDFYLDSGDHLHRVHDLSRKTNQFNLALKRLGEAEIADWLGSPARHVVTVALSDRLSDSGVVAMMLIEVHDRFALVQELCVSCRALGRKLEDVMILQGIAGALRGHDVSGLSFAYATGPRNSPARAWLETLSGAPLRQEGEVRLEWPIEGVPEKLQSVPVVTAWH